MHAPKPDDLWVSLVFDVKRERSHMLGGVCAFPHHWHALPCSFAKAVSAPAIRLAHVPLTIVYWLKYQYASPQHESARSLKSVIGPYMKIDNVTAGQHLYSQLALLTLQTLQMMHKMSTVSEGRPGQRPEGALVKAQTCTQAQ